VNQCIDLHDHLFKRCSRKELIFMPRTNELTCLALSNLAVHAFKAVLLTTLSLLVTVTSKAAGDDAFRETLTSAQHQAALVHRLVIGRSVR